MALKFSTHVASLLFQEVTAKFLLPVVSNVNVNIVRHRRTKHWNPKWKLFRRLKVMKVKLPKFNEKTSEHMTEEQIRSKLKEQGILPPRPWSEMSYFIGSTGGVFQEYVPPEGDGKISPVTSQGAKQSLQFLKNKTNTMMAIRKIRQFEEEFDTPDFCKEATKTYIKMHELMAAGDKENIIDYVTERAYPEVMHNIKHKSIHWKYLEDVELPRVVHARCTQVVSKENVFAQLTVRFHTKQVLAIYDRFGRLMHGSEILAKDVLEYVVFEKHLANEYGTWRVHAKIIPDWLASKDPSRMTRIKSVPKLIKEPREEEKKVTVTDTSKENVVTA